MDVGSAVVEWICGSRRGNMRADSRENGVVLRSDALILEFKRAGYSVIAWRLGAKMALSCLL